MNIKSMKTELLEKIEIAINLRKSGKAEEALSLLLPIVEVEEYSKEPDLHYQIAWTFDSVGKESDAVSFYEKAISLGLKNDREGAFLGLGSTYRCLGEYDKSFEVFTKAISEFPNNNALKTFQALTLYNLKRPADSVGMLIEILLATTSDNKILSYEKALRFYSDKLDETWK